MQEKNKYSDVFESIFPSDLAKRFGMNVFSNIRSSFEGLIHNLSGLPVQARKIP